MSENDDFNLERLIRAVAAEGKSADPLEVAAVVHRRIHCLSRDEALRQALPHLVRAEFRRSAPLSYLPLTDSPSGHWSIEAHSTVAAGGTPSRKVAAIRNWFEAAKRSPLTGADGTAKFLIDCTVFDLVAAAERREDHARRTAARAGQLRALAALLAEHDVNTVGDLPDAVLYSALSEAA